MDLLLDSLVVEPPAIDHGFLGLHIFVDSDQQYTSISIQKPTDSLFEGVGQSWRPRMRIILELQSHTF